MLHFFFFLPPLVYSGARCRYQGANDWKLITSHRLCGMHRALIKKQKLMGAPPPFHLSLCYIFWVRVRPPAARSAKPVSDFSFPEIFRRRKELPYVLAQVIYCRRNIKRNNASILAWIPFLTNSENNRLEHNWWTHSFCFFSIPGSCDPNLFRQNKNASPLSITSSK